ncbi:MAG TPA: alpha/beta hydrolase [Gemmatimonadaceae bacterium]|nr:alpha/beta hydrolase [Gemmatimonadaceae bacterium]
MFASTAAAQTEATRDTASHATRMVAVAPGVQLEVLDWGGSGRPVVLLAGLGATAHTFDDFAPQLATSYHVYGITRRGFGHSSAPMYGYGADTLADDVLAALDSLGLRQPVLAGHSMAGEELSDIGGRHPERVAGLVYLDAGYDYALYDTTHGNATIDLNELIRQLGSLRFGSGASAAERRRTMIALADTALPALSRSFHAILEDSPAPAGPAPQPMARIPYAIIAGQRKFTSVRGPVLAIFASPPEVPQGAEKDPTMREVIAEVDSATETQVRAFLRQVPQARVVRLPRANHFVYRSNPLDVLREMRAFIDRLPVKRE